MTSAAAVLLFGLGQAPAAVKAEATARDLQVLARALAFLEGAPSGEVLVGIVFPTGSRAGRAEAERVAAHFGTGLRSGAATLHPAFVALEDARQSPATVLLLTEAAQPYAAQLAAAVDGRRVLTVGTNRALADSGNVVMIVRAEPQVEIIANRAAAKAAGVRFTTAFRMLVQER